MKPVRPTALAADAGGSGLGAAYRLDGHLEDGRFPPDATSAPVEMEAALAETGQQPSR